MKNFSAISASNGGLIEWKIALFHKIFFLADQCMFGRWRLKNWHDFSNKVVSKLEFSKNVNNKKHAPKLIFFNEKIIEKDSDNFWRKKLTLKVRNCHFLIAWFRAEVDLTKNLFYEKVLFFTKLTSHFMSKLLKKS